MRRFGYAPFPMGRGCLPLVVLLLVALGVEWWLVDALGLPFGALIAVLLALALTLAVGSLQGVAQAWRQRAAPEDDPSTWRDGASIRVQGTLQAAAEASRAPFSERPAVYLEYGAWAVKTAAEVQVAQRAHWRGLVGAAAVLQTAAGPVALRGMPPARFWPEQQFSGEPYRTRAARHLAATAWRRATDAASFGPGDAMSEWTGQAQDGGTRMHVINAEAEHALGLDANHAVDTEALRQRLAERAWTFTERVVAPGAQVTVVGTYREQPRCIEVGLSPQHADHAVHPGSAAPLAARNWRTTLAFALALLALAVAAHLFVYVDGGAQLRRVLDALGLSASAGPPVVACLAQAM